MEMYIHQHDAIASCVTCLTDNFFILHGFIKFSQTNFVNLAVA